MAQERSVTPEKQLLNLIENPKARAAQTQAEAVKHHGMGMLSVGAWRGRASFVRDVVGKWVRAGSLKRFDIGTLNLLLVVTAAALAVYCVMSVVSSIRGLGGIPQLEAAARSAAKDVDDFSDPPSVVKALSNYLEKINARDIFRIGEREKKTIEEQTFKPPTPKIVEATANLKLVGISWSSDPDVMIEDTRAARTFFVKRGSMIGEVKVQAIFKDKIILSYGGEETELR